MYRSFLWYLSVFAIIFTGVEGLVAYDCGTPYANMTVISLTQIGDCDIPEPRVDKTAVYIQLLQILNYGNVHIRTCRIDVFREVTHCGMHSHSSAVAQGIAEYVKDVSREECNRMHESGRLVFGSTILDGLKKNGTTGFSTGLAGRVGFDAKCQGTHYTDPYGSWDDVIVQARVKITLSDYDAQTHLQSNQVILNTGTRCPIDRGMCLDSFGSTAFWDNIPMDSCKFNRYGVLYQGPASKLVDVSNTFAETIYTVISQDLTFALAVGGSKTLCGYNIIKTEHPKLFILEGQKERFFNSPAPPRTHDMDLFAYVNSKFIYVEKHVKTQVTNLYRDILLHRCALEQDLLRNAQALAIIKPEEFAYTYQRGPGYMAITTGEVIRLIKGVVVEDRRATTEKCYNELPVYKGETLMFRTPRTHILKSVGYEVPCNNVLPQMFQLEGLWFKVFPTLVESRAPHIMSPQSRDTWKYQSPGNLARQGIYTSEDLERLRDCIMSPFEQPAIVNHLVRTVKGEGDNSAGLSIGGLLDTETLRRIAESTWSRMWLGLSNFGTFSAGILGIVMILKVLKFLIDTGIHFFVLQRVFGWSFYLLGAIMDSMTNALLHLRPRSDTPPTTSSNSAELVQRGEIESLYPNEQLQEITILPSSATAPVEQRRYGLS